MPRRADIRTGRTTSNTHFGGAGTKYLVKTNGGVLYFVYVDSQSDVMFEKSSDNGLTWSDPVTVFTGTVTSLSVWYDRWSGIAGDLIHIAYVESVTNDCLYRSIDAASSDTLATQTTIFDGASAVLAGSQCSITRARGGNLGCRVCIDAGAEGGFFRSVDVGANWTSRTVDETLASTDECILLPSWNADNQDMMMFFWDASADEISRKLYDDSGNSWSETSIATSMVDATPATNGFPHFAAAVDLANSQNLLVAWSAVDTANADLRCWAVTEAAITESATNVVLNSTDDQGLAAIGIDTDTGHWVVFYAGKSDGSETWFTAVNLYYKVSTDSGATWGAETLLTQSGAHSIPWMCCTPRFVRPFAVMFLNNITLPEFRCSTQIVLPAAQSLVGM